MAGEAVLSSVLQEYLSKLSSGVANKLTLLLGLEGEREKLGSNLSRITAVLQDAESRQVQDKAAKDWLRKLKDVVYDAEDLLDELVVEDRRRKVENEDGIGKKARNFFSPLNPLCFRIKIAHKIQELRDKLDALAKENKDFPLIMGGVVSNQSLISDERETFSKVIESETCGRDDEIEKLIDSLLDSGNEEVLSVIPIVGMGGLGKTTLAQLVYSHERVVNHFGPRMWVYVSQDFIVKGLLEKILKSANGGKTEDQLSMDHLQTRLGEELSGKRYLLVLDDVWNEDHDKWDKLRTALKCGAIGSKILVTTRSDIVAGRMNALSRPPLGTLSEDESWNLFEKVAHPPSGFVPIGKEIVSKCGGVPLAIKTVGGMLLNEKSQTKWQSVRDSELWKRTDKEGRVLSILRLSYDHLTSSLKQCFLYCAVIPKGRRFHKYNLIKQWIAQGFIHSDDENDVLLEEEGENYFNELLCRSLFQVDVETYSDNPYMMHDLIHDLLKSVAGKEYLAVEEASMMNDETRHLALCNDEWAGELMNWDALKKCNKLRSMITYGYYPIDINVCLSCRCLRVLDLSYRNIGFLPNSIDKLWHLRYFDISDTEITELPETICNLHYLQTLRVLNIRLQKWPQNMKRMISLRHIEFDGRKDFPLPKGIGELTFLRTLPEFIITKESGAGIEELKDLNLLWGNIDIRGLDNITNVGCAHEADLKAKKYVNSLTLSWSGDETVAAEGNAKEVIEILEPHSNLKELSVENYTGLGFPSWMTEKLTNLKKISLSSCKRCEHLPPLGQLYFLESLKIDRMDAVKHIVEFDGSHNYKDLFPSLTDFHLGNMPNLERWSSPQEDGNGDEQGREIDKQAIFKCLRTLSISNCPKLICLPMFLLPALEKLNMIGVGCESIECSRSHSLKTVDLFDMRNLERWLLQEVDSDKDEQVTFGSLRTLRISKCPKLICLPQLLLPALEELKMREVGCERIDFSTSMSLKKVELDEMPNLERWSPHEADDGTPVIFHSLRTLRISKCPKLICPPQFLLPALEELKMREVGCEMIDFSTSKSLKKVELDEMPNLERWSPHEEDDGTLVIFRSPCSLRISKCPKLICLPQFLLPALEELKIEGMGWDKLEFSTSESLKEVELNEMPNLERWSPHEADDGTPVIFRSLRTLRISRCPKLICPPQLLLPALEELRMSKVGCERIEFSTSKSLKKVELTKMPNLERWSPQEGDDDEQVVFNSLVELGVKGCPRMVRLPHFVPSLEKLYLYDSNEMLLGSLANYTSLSELCIDAFLEIKRLPEELGRNHTSLSKLLIRNCRKLISMSNQLENLLALKELIIVSCDDLVLSLPDGLQQQQQRSPPLNSLEELHIYGLCERQTSLPGNGIVLPSLKKLRIHSCENIESLSPDMLKNLTRLTITDSSKVWSSLVSLENLKSLEHLNIHECPGTVMMKLLESMENLTSLTHLSIENCPGMRSLPESIKTLTSLTYLTISRCLDMRSLPEGLQHLKSLKWLWIRECPVLERRVQCNKGQDWHKVAHVSTIHITGGIASEDTEGEESSDQRPKLLLHSLKKLKLEKLLPLPLLLLIFSIFFFSSIYLMIKDSHHHQITSRS